MRPSPEIQARPQNVVAFSHVPLMARFLTLRRDSSTVATRELLLKRAGHSASTRSHVAGAVRLHNGVPPSTVLDKGENNPHPVSGTPPAQPNLILPSSSSDSATQSYVANPSFQELREQDRRSRTTQLPGQYASRIPGISLAPVVSLKGSLKELRRKLVCSDIQSARITVMTSASHRNITLQELDQAYSEFGCRP